MEIILSVKFNPLDQCNHFCLIVCYFHIEFHINENNLAFFISDDTTNKRHLSFPLKHPRSLIDTSLTQVGFKESLWTACSLITTHLQNSRTGFSWKRKEYSVQK